MHTASYGFQRKPEESAECHQTLSLRVGSGHKTTCAQEKPSITKVKVSFLIFSDLQYRYGDQTARDICALLTNFSSLKVQDAKQFGMSACCHCTLHSIGVEIGGAWGHGPPQPNAIKQD